MGTPESAKGFDDLENDTLGSTQRIEHPDIDGDLEIEIEDSEQQAPVRSKNRYIKERPLNLHELQDI